MDWRSVVKIKNSYYINIPKEICKALRIVKGDELTITHLNGLVLFIQKSKKKEV